MISARVARRLPRSAFTPPPAVDAGVLVFRRRPQPLVPAERAAAYHRFVADGFRRGLSSVVSRRERRSVGVERLQMLWLVWGAALIPFVLVLDIVLSTWFGGGGIVTFSLLLVAQCALVAAIGIDTTGAQLGALALHERRHDHLIRWRSGGSAPCRQRVSPEAGAVDQGRDRGQARRHQDDRRR